MPSARSTFREMAHGRIDEDQLLLVKANYGGFAAHLGHENDISRGVDVAQRRDMARQVVPRMKRSVVISELRRDPKAVQSSRLLNIT